MCISSARGIKVILTLLTIACCKQLGFLSISERALVLRCVSPRALDEQASLNGLQFQQTCSLRRLGQDDSNMQYIII